MKNLFVLLCLSTLCGCAYTENRVRDAADMITIAGEFPAVGLAVSGGYVGLAIPLYGGNGGGFGLRSGAVGSYEFKESMWLYGMFTKSLSPLELDLERGKGYDIGIFRHSAPRGGWFNTGQVEVAVGVGVGVRAGVNFCEIADFVVGLVGIDICDDDIAGEAEKPQLKEVASARGQVAFVLPEEELHAADHNPIAAFQGDTSRDLVELSASPGETVKLSAAGSSDPDGDQLSYRWWQDRELGSFRRAVSISDNAARDASFVAPSVSAPRTIHVILTVADDGHPSLYSQRRIIVTVKPK